MIIIFIRAVHKHSSFLSKHLVVLHFLIQFEFRCGQVTSCSQWWLITWSIYKLEPPSFWVREHLQGTNLHACAQSWLTLCNPMDCSPPGSTVHEISQARIQERVAMPSSRGSSWPREIKSMSPALTGRFCTVWVSRIPSQIFPERNRWFTWVHQWVF